MEIFFFFCISCLMQNTGIDLRAFSKTVSDRKGTLCCFYFYLCAKKNAGFTPVFPQKQEER